ncbi:hypothetical protein GCM10010168_21340 [Actinoplanes ianthinogenes]|uniref:Uncharacterized protein n=1 Tax=Actinoplanes ianthinogenes TaxID=122358 RepID=A0ABM7M838_9ACTN|nr:hypothetical protein [Actinoplanes ianthinogenes]BCJ47775.1 hypothetical protein Aiant_84320 [Actinoplanes ianthinogenes]GGR04098.1 hypothetical protein GCM10010168_21340 [Actinoplanes ianthinogenes]
MLQSWANSSGQIDYPGLATKPAAEPLFSAVAAVRKRQAVLHGLEGSGVEKDVVAWAKDHGLGPSLVGTYDPERPWIRSSHSGTPIDVKLPQGPYDSTKAAGAPGGPPAAAAVGLIVGPANWNWLESSTTEHTTAKNAKLVASYFEFGLGHIPKVDGGRLVFDPFNYRWFVSEHYAVQYEVINVPPATTDPIVGKVRGAADKVVTNTVSFDVFIDGLWRSFQTAKF